MQLREWLCVRKIQHGKHPNILETKKPFWLHHRQLFSLASHIKPLLQQVLAFFCSKKVFFLYLNIKQRKTWLPRNRMTITIHIKERKSRFFYFDIILYMITQRGSQQQFALILGKSTAALYNYAIDPNSTHSINEEKNKRRGKIKISKSHRLLFAFHE